MVKNSVIDINLILDNLRRERKLFHSEADLQFSLAWVIKKLYNDDVKIRMEYPFRNNNSNKYFDILLYWKDEGIIPIELKYKTVNN